MADLTTQQLLSALTDQLNVMADEMVTKKDLEQFATKKDLEAFATKKDLAGHATKKDLTAFATKKDFERLETKITGDLKQTEIRLRQSIRSSHTANVKHHLETREAIGDLNRQFYGLREGLAHAADPVD